MRQHLFLNSFWKHGIVLFAASCFLINTLAAQITVSNPSFEDTPSDATTPKSWSPCEELTTPDILPGFWGVYNEPSHGDTYVGIITRSDHSFESFGQRLSAPVEKKQCYTFQIDLAYSMIYSGFNHPLKLKVYLANDLCGKKQLIYESDYISHTNWKTYTQKFYPDGKYQYLLFEAYKGAMKQPIKGNILLDNLQSIKKCNSNA